MQSQNFAGGSYDGSSSVAVLCGGVKTYTGGSYDGFNRQVIPCGGIKVYSGGSYDGFNRVVQPCGGTHNYSGGSCSGDYTNLNYCSGYVYVLKSCVSTALLPISLLEFDAQCQTSGVFLSWKTAMESQTGYFMVDRAEAPLVASVNGNFLDWKEIGSVDAAGNSNIISSYFFVDDLSSQEPGMSGKIYLYRLRLFNIDGVSESYTPASVAFPCGSPEEIIIYPNPNEGIMNISVSSTIVRIEVTGLAGQIVFQSGIGRQSSLLDLSHLSDGTYIVKVSGGNQNWFQKVCIRR